MTTTGAGRRLDRRAARLKGTAAIAGFSLVALTACTGSSPEEDTTGYTTREATDGTTTFVVVYNPGDGPTLTYSTASGMSLLDVDVDGATYAFKDMNGNGELDTWEDWREDSRTRADDLAAQLTTEQISGLMLVSAHQRSAEDGMTEDQETFLSQDHIRNVLASTSNDVTANVTWTNQLQEYVETSVADGEAYIPVNFSSDPRSSSGSSSYTANDGTYFPEAGTGETISLWPSNLGLAATFDPDLVEDMGQMVSDEYRALGFHTSLGPQVDLATDPRNLRNNGTFGEDVEMAAAMANAFVTGFQTDTEGSAQAYGSDSVQVTLKHFPGDGAGEGGREGHNPWGKYVVYPGGAQMEPVKVFEAALDSSAVMMSYSVGVAADGSPAFGGDELVGSAYDAGKVDILREDLGYDGVIMTDWGVTTGSAAAGQKTYGVEDLSVEEQHYAILAAGLDMFGGNNELAPVLAAYDLWQTAYEAGEQEVDAATRWAQSGARILDIIVSSGAYESPYTDLDHSLEVAGDQTKVDAGIEAQLGSVVMLKNSNGTVQCSAEETDYADQTVYIPNSFSNAFNMLTMASEFTEGPTLDTELAGTYFGDVVTDTPVLNADGSAVERYETPDLTDVDVVMVGMSTPNNGGMPGHGYDTVTEQYRPVSLQYRPYTADGEHVRQVSIAGDALPDGTQENRSYYGQTSSVQNEADLDAYERAVAAVAATGRDIPIIVVMQSEEIGSVIPAEFEAGADVIVMGYEVAQQAYFEIALGLHDASGRLPLGLPASMDAVEASYEDVSKDVESYVDSAGNTYEYGFGLSCSGVITG